MNDFIYFIIKINFINNFIHYIKIEFKLGKK